MDVNSWWFDLRTGSSLMSDDFSFADFSVRTPFLLRFRPFIARRDSLKMPSNQAFGALRLGNAV
jgi:hypothetical protein